MAKSIGTDFMAFLSEGQEGIGGVREVRDNSLVVYVENAGDFVVPMEAVTSVHDKKVMLDRHLISAEMLAAIRHAHDREDPKLVG